MGDGGQISAVIIMLRGISSPSFPQSSLLFYLRLHFSPRAKVSWAGEQRKVKGNAGRARGRWLSLAVQLDLLTHNLKFYSQSFFHLFFVMHGLVLSLLPDQAKINEMSSPEF